MKPATKNILYFVSGHGFGHSVRSSQVVRELHALGHSCTIVSSAPRFIFEVNLRGVPFEYIGLKGDVGVVQVDSIQNDLGATLVEWNRFLDRTEEWIRLCLGLCRQKTPKMIVSDIVPLAFPLARRAGIPSCLVATFTWDWILDHYREDNRAFFPLAERLRNFYGLADRLITTPFAYGLPDIRPVHAVSMIGKRASAPKRILRERMGLDRRKAFFISFGGCGINDISRMGLERLNMFQFIFLRDAAGKEGNSVALSNDDFMHEEVVAASDAVIGKPGYGLCTECALNQTPLVYTSRGKFAEYEPLSLEMQNYFPAIHIPQSDLFDGGLHRYLIDIPPFKETLAKDPGNGAREAAEIISENCV